METQLKSKGWFFTNEGLELCKEGLVNPSVDSVIQRALDIDLRLLSSGSPDDSNKGKVDVQGPLVMQIQKIRNIAAPKMNEESNYAPKLLRLQLTDGHSAYSGLLLHSIPKIDMNTMPGTKVLIKGEFTLKQGLMLLDQANTKVLGGHVDEMVERWKLIKTLSQFTRATKVEGAPPPWMPFGQRNKMATAQRSDHGGKGGKKSQEGNQKDPTDTDKAFEEQRNAAIQEVGKRQSKKFGGGKSVPSTFDRLKESRKIQEEKKETAKTGPVTKAAPTQGIYRELSHDSNKPDETDIQKLTSMGFGREASIAALKRTNGNVDSAVDSLLAGGRDDRGPDTRDGPRNFNQGFDSRGGEEGPRNFNRGFDSRGGGRGTDSRRGGRGNDSRCGGRNFDSRGRGRGSDSRRRREDDGDDDEYPSQPSGGTTLFDFLESKLGKDNNNKDSSNSNGGGQRSRNYAREQPASVRESGIRFVHGEDAIKDGGKRVGPYDGGSKDDASFRASQNFDNRRGQNDRRPNARRNDTRPQNDRGPSSRPQSDRGLGRPRQDKGGPQGNQRSTQYTIPPRFQKLQEAESKQGPVAKREEREAREDPKKDPPQVNGRQGSRGGPGSIRLEQRPQPDRSNHERSSQPQLERNERENPPQPDRNNYERGNPSQPDRNNYERGNQPDRINYERSNPEENNMIHWNVGDMCIAKYWEDNAFYPASITAIHPSGKTCVVHFMEYGNQEEVLMADIVPLPNQPWGGMPPPPHQYPPPNHMMVPPNPYQDARNNYQQVPHPRYNPNQGNNNFYQGRR